MALISIVPLFIGAKYFGLTGFIGTLIGQIFIVSSFNTIHGLIHKNKADVIRKTLNQIVGPFRNHMELLISLLALPGLWVIRISQIIIWPLLV